MTARANAPQPTASVLKTSEESNVKATLEVLIMFISMSTVVFTRVTTVKLIEILQMKMIGNHLINSPHLENEYDGVVTELLDKCGLMRSSYSLSLRINKVLQVKMIEAEKSVKRILTS